MRKALTAVCLLATAVPLHADDSKPSQADLDQLLKSTDDIAATVSKIRGLPIKKKIDRGIMSRPEITKRLLDRMAEETPTEELVAEERAYKRLGLFPMDGDLKKTVVDLLTEQIAGFYDPESKELYLADWIDVGSQRMVMAHEIDHALQDQNFDLNKLTKPIKDNADEELARTALVEGDGVALMIEFMVGPKQDPWANDAVVNAMALSTSMPGMSEFDHAPLFLKDSLIFPYVAGLKFIAASRRTHPWSDIDSVYRSPPLSTEQILHPEKYRAGEKPIPIQAGEGAALKGWSRLYENVLGEMMFDVLLEQYGIARDVAQRAAAGWGGDRIVVYAPPKDDGKSVDSLVAIDLSAWDQEADAIEAQTALIQLLTKVGGAAPSVDTNGAATVTDANGQIALVERHGSRVLFVLGAPKDLAPKIQADAWAKWK